MGDTQLSALTEGNTQGGERGIRWREGGGRQAKESLPHRAEEQAANWKPGNRIRCLPVTCLFAISYLVFLVWPDA